jgi:lipooligosaccharide transport system ATP-binding protein
MEEAFQLCDRMLIMHKGQKIMEGKPGDLLEENIEECVLEVLDADSTKHVHDDTLLSRVRVDHAVGVARYYSNDIDALKDLAASHLETGNYLIRHTNLEDVFLKATGRQLDDKQ